MAQAQAKKEPITGRPADLLEPEWDALARPAAELDGFNGTEEDVLTNAMFPGSPRLLRHPRRGPKNVGKTRRAEAEQAAAAEDNGTGRSGCRSYKVTLDGRAHSVAVEPA